MPIDIRNGRYFSARDPVVVQLALADHVEVATDAVAAKNSGTSMSSISYQPML